jgi:hypothetical protein
MTYAAPTCDYYDDGLVHSHDWSRNTPPGGKHGERGQKTAHAAHDRDDALTQDHRRTHS